MDDFEGVFRAVDRGLCRYGILPLENSTAGSVTAVYELMQKYHSYIVASTRLFVGHVLLANHGASLSGIKEIFSHEQAINQCSEFLAAHKNIKVTVCANTATAAKAVSESGRTDAAAICSPECAELYNLRQIDDHIANTANNYTRFICISKDIEIYPGANRTSLMARLAHKPGSLYNVIARFAALGINLTKLESRPVAGSDFEFAFYFDIDASIYSKELAELIIQLENEIPELCYLGSYNEI
jgi:chorismate mutase/prephenate dehydratase